MQAKIDFDTNINEVVYLNNISRQDSKNDKIYFKVIILLLSAKLEKYVKDSTKEYINTILKFHLTKDKLPQKFVKEIIKNELKFIEDKSIEKYLNNDNCKKRAQIFSLIWDARYKLHDLGQDDFVISISNNGTNAFKETYKKIGFDNMIEQLSDYTEESDVSDLETTTKHSICETINKIIKIRHEIIHEDATPSITRSNINLFVNILKSFVEQIDAILTQELNSLSENT